MNQNVELVRSAYRAYVAGDVPTMLRFVDPNLEWTYLDPGEEHPHPQVCHGRAELEHALRRLAKQDLSAELEEVAGTTELVMVGVRTPGLGATRGRPGEDRSFAVLSVRDGRIVALRDCHDRDEALRLAGLA